MLYQIPIQIQQILIINSGNDDARRSINLYCDLLKNTIKDAEKFIKGNEKEPKNIVSKEK